MGGAGESKAKWPDLKPSEEGEAVKGEITFTGLSGVRCRFEEDQFVMEFTLFGKTQLVLRFEDQRQSVLIHDAVEEALEGRPIERWYPKSPRKKR